MRKPRALASGDPVAVIAPASSAATDEITAGLEELRALGFQPRHEPLLASGRYTAGTPAARAAALRHAWLDPDVKAVIALRGGYGSVQLLPLLDPPDFAGPPKAFIGYSDNTSLLSWLTLSAGIVTFHGPMVEGRFARGPAAYDRDSFERCLMRTQPMGEVTHEQLEIVRAGEASGMLLGGTMTQLAGSLGTPYAFDPPQGCILFFDEVGERPYRVDRIFTQLQQAGIIDRASALVFGEMPRCDEPAGRPAIRDVVADLTEGFPGPVLFGLPSGHTNGATLTLPFGVQARVVAHGRPSLVIEESAVA
ncbi:MAG: LD-carboxypeptidase [Vicinamibacterales bacterium]